jgi:hypothetical protein
MNHPSSRSHISRTSVARLERDIVDFSQDEIKERFTLFEDGPKYTLVIKKPHLEDEGQYTVKVRDSNVCSTACLSVTGKKNLF